MKNNDVREQPGPTLSAGGPVFDLVASKLLPPLNRPGTVSRSSLIERLAGADPHRIISVVAPPGYGKTTLLSQWAERADQPERADFIPIVGCADLTGRHFLVVRRGRPLTAGGWSRPESQFDLPGPALVRSLAQKKG